MHFDWPGLVAVFSFILGLLAYFHASPAPMRRHPKETKIIRRPVIAAAVTAGIGVSGASIALLVTGYDRWQPEIWPLILWAIMINDAAWYVILSLPWSSPRIPVFMLAATIYIVSHTALQTITPLPTWERILRVCAPALGLSIAFLIQKGLTRPRHDGQEKTTP